MWLFSGNRTTFFCHRLYFVCDSVETLRNVLLFHIYRYEDVIYPIFLYHFLVLLYYTDLHNVLHFAGNFLQT